jgi:hypothetical protein
MCGMTLIHFFPRPTFQQGASTQRTDVEPFFRHKEPTSAPRTTFNHQAFMYHPVDSQEDDITDHESASDDKGKGEESDNDDNENNKESEHDSDEEEENEENEDVIQTGGTTPTIQHKGGFRWTGASTVANYWQTFDTFTEKL